MSNRTPPARLLAPSTAALFAGALALLAGCGEQMADDPLSPGAPSADAALDGGPPDDSVEPDAAPSYPDDCPVDLATVPEHDPACGIPFEDIVEPVTLAQVEEAGCDPCRFEGVYLATDAELAALADHGCQTLRGMELGPEVTSLRPLAGVRAIGHLDLEDDSAITDLAGLEQLEVIERLTLRGAGLTDITALERLAVLGRLELDGVGVEALTLPRCLTALDELRVDSVPALRSIDMPPWSPLAAELSLARLELMHLPALTAIDGLHGLRAVERGYLWGSPELTDLSAIALDTVGELYIREFATLTRLPQITAERVGKLALWDNAALTDLHGLEAITRAEDLAVTGSPALDDLTPLAALARVDGTLHLGGLGSTDLTGLDALRRVRRLTVEAMPALETFAGLDDLRLSEIEVRGNPALAEITGVQARDWFSQIFLIDNPALRRVEGFDQAPRILDLVIRGVALTDMTAFAAVDTLDLLEIGEMPALRTLDGLDRVVHTNTLRVDDNPLLESLGPLDGVNRVRDVRVQGNPRLTDLDGFGAMDWLITLTVTGNAALVDLRGLGPVDDLRELTIEGNAALVSVDGLEALTSVASTRIIGNPALTSLAGLGGLIGGDRVEVRYNATLPQCLADGLAFQLDLACTDCTGNDGPLDECP